MKRNIKRNICIVGISILVFTGCKKYLDVEPISGFSNDFVFSDVQNANLAVLGAYDALSGDQGYGIRLNLYYGFDTDEGASTAGNPNDNQRGSIAFYEATPSNAELEKPFLQLYQGVERANLCIEQIPLMDLYNNGTATQKAELRRMHGEVLTLRAQYYLELLRVWGDLPAPMVPSYKQPDLFLPKENRDNVYDKLLSDLVIASTLVPWRSERPNPERITKGFVKGLRARIALYRGGYALRRESNMMERRSDYLKYYQIARDECFEIMNRRGDHDLNSSFETIFHDYICALKQDPKGEVMFEVAMAGANGSSDSKLGYSIGTVTTLESRYGGSNPIIFALPNYFYAFDSLDKRRDVTIGLYSVLGSNLKFPEKVNTLRLAKFRRDWRTPAQVDAANYLGYNWPIMRFSDILLMFAEAENELNSGATGPAITALTEVRTRAFGGDATKIGVIPTSHSEFFKAIVKERWFEFGGEGIRKWDLIRWNLLGTRLAETKTEIIAISDTTKYPRTMEWQNVGEEIKWRHSFYHASPIPDTTANTPWKKVNWTLLLNSAWIESKLATKYFQPNKDELFPINQGAINANRNLTQDYGF